MAKRFIWINYRKQHSNEFKIGYMINLGLNVNKSFREKCKNVYILYLVKSHNVHISKKEYRCVSINNVL